MHPIFLVTEEEIQHLTDKQSRELIARLCKAELKQNGVSGSAVSWGGDQRTPDGGVDVLINIDPPSGRVGFIKSDRCVFQVKAEIFYPGKIPGEMAPHGDLRPAIIELAAHNGAYIIASTRDSLSATSHTVRVKAMEACLTAHGVCGKVIVDFYDCRKIADWAEQYPATVNWIKHKIGRPINGWQPYSPWAFKETDLNAEYLLDDKVKIFMPDGHGGTDARSAINQLRSDLQKNVSIRIVGLSGVGKTRIVQALFDTRLVTEAECLDPENVIYTDLSSNPTPQPSVLIEALKASGSDCVVIIDNCGQDVHQTLTEIIKKAGCNLRLITIEYDIRDDIPEDTRCYRIESSSDEVIKTLLKRRYPILSDNDLQIIAEFSEGNARVAFALASLTETKGELARLRDTELFRRLFVQRHEENEELQRIAEAASLLYSFDGEDDSPISEMALLASLVDVSVKRFARGIILLERRGLVQRRGKWRAILPHAISNRLAMQAIDGIPKSNLKSSLVENASDRVIRSFSRRLGYLHESTTASMLVKEWLEEHGRYGDLSNLDELGRQIFANIAPVDQDAALLALERATSNSGFVSLKNDNRSHFVRIARLLAFESKYFDRAIAVLIRYAIIEPEGQKHDSTCDILKSLFYCYLSGSEAPPDQRSQIVRSLILSDDVKMQNIGFLLLEAAFTAWHFSSAYGFEFGARKRSNDWRPHTYGDLRIWYNSFIEIAIEVGKNSTERGKRARSILGNAVPGLCMRAGLYAEILKVGKELVKIDGWPEGWIGIRRILQMWKRETSDPMPQEIRDIEKLLAPRDLKVKIEAKVLTAGVFEELVDDGDERIDDSLESLRRADQEVENLGQQAAFEPLALSELLPKLLNDVTNRKVWSFGYGVGQAIDNPLALLAQLRLMVNDSQVKSLSLLFVRGFISGWYKVKPKEIEIFLDEALNDEVWIRHFPELQLEFVLDSVSYNRLLTSLNSGKTPIRQYQMLAGGMKTDPLSVDQISTLVKEISKKSDGGLLIAIDILAMVVHCANVKDTEYRRKLADVCISFLQELDWLQLREIHDRVEHDINEICKFTLFIPWSEEIISAIIQNLLTYERSEYRYLYRLRGNVLATLFEHYPLLMLDAIYVPDEDGTYYTASQIVSSIDGDLHKAGIGAVSLNPLIEWCDVSPNDRYLFAAQTCHLFSKTAEADSNLVLSDVAQKIIEKAPDKKAVIEIMVDRFHPRGWSGSRAAALRSRLSLFQFLNPLNDTEVAQAIEQAENAFKEQIHVIEIDEQERERRRSLSFE